MKTPYELWKGRKPNISDLTVFGCLCFVLNNNKEQKIKSQFKSDEGYLIGYPSTSKGYRIFHKKFRTVEESIHVVFDETSLGPSRPSSSSEVNPEDADYTIISSVTTDETSPSTSEVPVPPPEACREEEVYHSDNAVVPPEGV